MESKKFFFFFFVTPFVFFIPRLLCDEVVMKMMQPMVPDGKVFPGKNLYKKSLAFELRFDWW